MTQIFIVVSYDFDSASSIGAFSTLELAEQAMRVWVDKDRAQKIALAKHWEEVPDANEFYLERTDDKGALYFEDEHDNGLLVRVLELDAPCQFRVIEWLAALQ